MNNNDLLKEITQLKEQQNDLIQRVEALLLQTMDEKTTLIAGTFDDETALQVKDLYPLWQADKAVVVGDRYRYNDKLYKCIQSHTTQAEWTPDTVPALWTEVSLEEYPEWKQPLGSEDAYNKGDKVTHNNKKWVSDVDANVWEPGVSGWSEVTEDGNNNNAN